MDPHTHNSHHHHQTVPKLEDFFGGDSAASTTTTTTTTTTTKKIIISYSEICFSCAEIFFSVYHISFRRRSVKFITSILSLRRSFLPLLLTSLASLLLQFLISFDFGVVLFVILYVQFMVFGIDQSSPVFFLPCLIVGVVFLLVLIYLQVNWALSSIIVVVEHSWGFEPLWRSTKLVKGMRGITLSLMVIYEIGSGAWVFLMRLSLIGDEFDGGVWSWRSWLFVLQIVSGAAVVMVLMLQYLVANQGFVEGMDAHELSSNLIFDLK